MLFYGSCLREKQLDGLMLDFYLIVSDYRAAYGKRWLATANRLIPPNVFYFEHDGLVAKYAVLSEADFHRLCGPETSSVSVWARFAQPSRLVWSCGRGSARAGARRGGASGADLACGRAAAGGRGVARRCGGGRSRSLIPPSFAPSAKTRASSVVDADPERYQRFDRVRRLPRAQRCAPHGSWAWRRIEGKALSVARLAKASLTFAGGADYIAWKINRHAGTDIQLEAVAAAPSAARRD